MNRMHVKMAALVFLLAFGLVSTSCAAATVEERLQKLEDVEAIRNLLIDYGRALDARDFDAYGKLFAKDGAWKGGMGGATGPEQIAQMVREGFGRMDPKQYENSNHVMTSMDIEVNGDTATAWSRWLWVIPAADGKMAHVPRAGHYEDTLVREDGQWKFKTRQAFTEINK